MTMGKQTGLQMKYFVLKPHGDDPYAKASRVAMRAYAVSIRQENSELANSLVAWADSETDFDVIGDDNG